MTIPTEMLDKADFERLEKGLPLEPKPKVEMPEYKEPEIPNRLDISKVPRFLKKIEGTRRTYQNSEGVSFIGFDVCVAPEEGKPIMGWVNEGELWELGTRLPEDLQLKNDGVHCFTRERTY